MQPKMSNDAEEELRRRRERGRRSQAAFRKRQANAAEQLADQRTALIGGVKRLVSAARGDESPELISAISYIAGVAGLDFKIPTSNHRFSQFTGNDIDINVRTRESVPASNCHEGALKSYGDSTSTASERLSCGIWMDTQHYMRISLAPQDIIPYLGKGARAFAGTLFWTVTEHFSSGCKNHHVDPTTVVQQGLDHSKATRDIKVPFIKAMIEARLEYKEKGFMTPVNAVAGEEDLGMVVCDRIKEEYRTSGKDPDLWLSCTAISKYAERLLGKETFRIVEEAALGKGSDELRQMVQDLYCKFCDTGVCFGDGPRWSTEVVEEQVFGFLGKAIMLSISP